VRGADTLGGGQVEIAAEMVVLAPALLPSDGVRELARTLRIGYDQHGYLSEAHPKLKPVETNTAGIFLAGACHSPKDIPDSVAQASAAASKALGIVSHTQLTREPTVGIEDDSVDVAISNCVINLSPDKRAVFDEVFRVLKPGGELFFSDVFAERRVPPPLQSDPCSWASASAGRCTSKISEDCSGKRGVSTIASSTSVGSSSGTRRSRPRSAWSGSVP